MEIGDYIRYKEDGIQKIGRIEKISATLADDVLIIEVDNGDVITSDDILKSDKSILHEIEVEDYVNGYKVIDIVKGFKVIIDKLELNTTTGLYHNIGITNIKSIVTKQQFEAMQYVIKGD